MCRWLAYTGAPVLLTDVLYTPVHSLIDQSLHSRLGAETTNGDGFGVGWYDAAPAPGVFRSIEPAWNDQNLRELAGHVRSPLFFDRALRDGLGQYLPARDQPALRRAPPLKRVHKPSIAAPGKPGSPLKGRPPDQGRRRGPPPHPQRIGVNC